MNCIRRNPGSWDEQQLLLGVLDRMPEAWAEFEHRYERLVLTCIRKVLRRFKGVLSSDDESDALAHFYLVITLNDMRKLRVFDPSRNLRFSSWVARLATNAAWDHVRTRTRDSACVGLEFAEEVPEPEQDPFEAISRKQQAATLERALCKLTKLEREFVRLFYARGLTPDEVAEAMGISVKTVYSKHHKVRARLEAAALLEERRAGLRMPYSAGSGALSAR